MIGGDIIKAKYFVINMLVGFGICGLGYFYGDTVRKKRIKHVGSLIVDSSEQTEPPQLYLELETDPNNFVNGKYAVFKIVKK